MLSLLSFSGDVFTSGHSHHGNSSINSGDIVGVEIDTKKHTITFYHNSVLQSVGFSKIPPKVKVGVSGQNFKAAVLFFGRIPKQSFTAKQEKTIRRIEFGSNISE